MKRTPVLLLALLAFLLSACGGTQPPGKVRVAVWSQPLAEQANLYAADELGYFKEQSLQYEFVPGQGGGDALKHLMAGNAQVAFTNLEPVFFAVEQGAKLKVIYNIYPQNVFNLVTLKGAGIKKVADLKGKKVGVYSLASGTRHNLMVMLRAAGLKETDVEVVPVGIANFGPLLKGEVTAMAATDTGLWGARQQGLGEVEVLWARDVLNTPTDAFVVTAEFYQQNKDLIRRFLVAYRKGSQWMLDNPEKAAELAQKHATDGKDVARNLEMVKLRNESTVDASTRANGLGWFDLNLLAKVEQTYRELGITSQPIDVKALFTNEFVTKQP